MDAALQTSVAGITQALNSNSLRASNIANVQTPGYKTKRLDISSASESTVRTSQKQGALVYTSEPSDVALVGRGFFALESKTGETVLRRNLQIQRNADGNLTDTSGNKINTTEPLPPNSQLVVSEDGSLFAQSANGDSKKIGKLLLVDVGNPESLSSQDASIYTTTNASGEIQKPSSPLKVAQGYQENSNSNLADDMVGQMEDLSTVRANAATIRTRDAMLGELMDLKG